MRFGLWMVAAAAVLGAGQAFGQTITQSIKFDVYSGTNYYNLFDPSLGQLSSVFGTVTQQVYQPIYFGGAYGLTGPISYALTGYTTLYGFPGNPVTAYAASGDLITYTSPYAASYQITTTFQFSGSQLASFIGYGKELISPSPSITNIIGTQGGQAVSLSPQYSGRGGFVEDDVELSFVYFLPEPATWAMMIVGVGIIGFALRRRQKVSASVKFA